MNKNVLFKSTGGASYFHSAGLNQFLLFHPVLQYLYRMHQQGVDLNHWLKNLGPTPLTIDNWGEIEKEEIHYYLKKFRLLEANGYFTDVDTESRLSGRLIGRDIEINLANNRTLVFEVTEACNLNCEYCGYGKFYNNYDARENKNMDIKTARRFIDFLACFWSSDDNRSHHTDINIGFYGGEPLLRMDFIEDIVGYTHTLDLPHNHFTYGMTTNATLLDKHMDFLVEHDFLILISLDGSENHNGYRVYHNGKPAFKEIIENVKTLSGKYPDYFEKRVNFNSVLHNKNSIAEIVEYFINTFDKMPVIAELNTVGIAPQKREEFWKTYKNYRESISGVQDYSIFDKDIFKIPGAKTASDIMVTYSGFISRNFNAFYFDEKNSSFIPTATCLPFTKKVFLSTACKIYPCERIGSQYALGFVNKDRVHLDFGRVAETYNRYFDKINNQCRSCANSRECGKCIFTMDIDGAKPICDSCMNSEELSAYLAEGISYLEKNPMVYKKMMREVMVG